MALSTLLRTKTNPNARLGQQSGETHAVAEGFRRCEGHKRHVCATAVAASQAGDQQYEPEQSITIQWSLHFTTTP